MSFAVHVGNHKLPEKASNQINSTKTKDPLKKPKVKSHEHELLYSANGLVTVFVSWTDPENKTNFHHMKEKEILEMVSE